MPFIEKRIHSGKVTEIYRFKKIVRKTTIKSSRRNPTPFEMRKVNIRNACLKCERLIRCNFTKGDFHATFTYSKAKWGNKGPTPVQAKKEYTKLMRKIRGYYKKLEKDFKYIAVTEYNASRIHHHIILEKIDMEVLQKKWGDNGSIHITPLYADYDYKHLAEYLVKETRESREETFEGMFKKRWNSSKHLEKPKEEPLKVIKRVDVTKPPKEVTGMSRGCKEYQNYKLIDQNIGYHEITGSQYSYWKVIEYENKRS